MKELSWSYFSRSLSFRFANVFHEREQTSAEENLDPQKSRRKCFQFCQSSVKRHSIFLSIFPVCFYFLHKINMMLSKSRSDLRKFPSTLSAFIQFAIFFIWAIVVGVVTILILFTTVSVFCCLLYSYSLCTTSFRQSCASSSGEFRDCGKENENSKDFIQPWNVLHHSTNTSTFSSGMSRFGSAGNAKLLVLPATFYLSEIDNSLACFCFYCSFY